MISLNSSKFVGDCAVKAAALAELRCANADAAAVAQFVDFVEQVHDIETDFDGCLSVIWIRRDRCTLNVS